MEKPTTATIVLVEADRERQAAAIEILRVVYKGCHFEVVSSKEDLEELRKVQHTGVVVLGLEQSLREFVKFLVLLDDRVLVLEKRSEDRTGQLEKMKRAVRHIYRDLYGSHKSADTGAAGTIKVMETNMHNLTEEVKQAYKSLERRMDQKDEDDRVRDKHLNKLLLFGSIGAVTALAFLNQILRFVFSGLGGG